MAALGAGCDCSLWPQGHTYALDKGRASSENVFTPLVFLPSHLPSLHTFLPIHNFPQVFPSTKLSSINHESHFHLSDFRPLHKILTVNHYLRKPRFSTVPLYLSPSSSLLPSPSPLTIHPYLEYICLTPQGPPSGPKTAVPNFDRPRRTTFGLRWLNDIRRNDTPRVTSGENKTKR